MRIGEAAQGSGVSAKMIRYYESVGLIGHAARTEGNYRTYTVEDVHTLRFIKRARSLGFSVKQMQHLLALWHDKERSSAEVKSVTLQHIAELEHKIAELQSMVQTLKHLAERCSGDDRPNCPILEDFASPGSIHNDESMITHDCA